MTLCYAGQQSGNTLAPKARDHHQLVDTRRGQSQRVPLEQRASTELEQQFLRLRVAQPEADTATGGVDDSLHSLPILLSGRRVA